MDLGFPGPEILLAPDPYVSDVPWAQYFLISLEGVKETKDGYKRVLGCSQKGCNYRLYLKSAEKEKDFQVFDKLRKKYNKHSNFIVICFNNLLDHKLNYEEKSIFDEIIDNELHFLQGQVRSLETITKMVNERFNVNFEVHRIKYRMNKLQNERLGHAEDDANKFVKLAEEDVEASGAFFRMKLDKDRKFQMALYCSKIILIYYKYFLDIVIIDST